MTGRQKKFYHDYFTEMENHYDIETHESKIRLTNRKWQYLIGNILPSPKWK